MKALLLTFLLALATPAFADNTQAPANRGFRGEIPTGEKEFVEVINNVDKQQLIEQFGEPSIRDDMAGPDGEIIASVWHYRYLNTDENGEYYKTTELDFLQDKVVMVVFMNHEVEAADEQTQQPEQGQELEQQSPAEPFQSPAESFGDTPLLDL
jgi:hypothetical protein